MALIIGMDSYVSLEEADEYIVDSYLSNSAQIGAWNRLSDSDKSVVLKTACRAIENIRYIGKKKDSTQVLSFPRCVKNVSAKYYGTNVVYGSGSDCEDDVSGDVKSAQIEEALELVCPSEDTKDFNIYNGSVKSYSISSLSETFINSSGEYGTLKSELRSKKAQKLLMKYIGGGYCVD